MDAFLGAIGLVGTLVGIVLIVLGKIKKRKYRGGLIAIVSFVLFVIAISLTNATEKADSKEVDSEEVKEETAEYKLNPGKISNNSILNTLAVRAESIIEKYDKIDGVKVKTEDITAEKVVDQKDNETNEVYENIYSVDGTYIWDDRRFDFEWVISFDENNVDESGKIIQFTSDINANPLNVDRSAVE